MSTLELTRLVSQAQTEVSRQMTVCNACRYCEGICGVFPAMELRTEFGSGDVDYLANLCHNCGACYFDCQYAPPHEFAINVPVALSTLREESYARYAWPSAASGLFERNGLKIAWLSVLAIAIFIAGFVGLSDPQALFASGTEQGAFYRVMPHNAMVLVFGGVFLFSIVAISMGVRQFWRGPGPLEGVGLNSLLQASRDAASLRYLDGGGMGCMNDGERPDNKRRRYHHYTFYGFLLCLASTSIATIFHYVFDWQAPYAWWSAPVVLGTIGGIGIVVGPWGLLQEKKSRYEAIRPAGNSGMDAAFLWMLMMVGVTGLLLLFLRATPAMGLILAVHLGFVFAFFLSMPYGKFVHGLYRFAALMRHAHEQAVHAKS
ncbi:MAG: tricarballylate utilization 4Fe-4S protein TcuB [Burkholderiaceae bacterium]